MNRILIIFLISFLLGSCCTYNANRNTKIGAFIDSIDSDNQSVIGFPDKRSSYLGAPYFGYVGTNYAYYVDYIIKNPKVCVDSVENVVYREYWNDKNKGEGIIVKIQKDSVSDSLSLSDMRQIKQMYLDWWSKNGRLSQKKQKAAYEREPILKAPYKWK